MSFNLRYATKDDAILVANISRQTFYETFAPSNTKEDMDKFLDEQFTLGRLMLEVGRSENIFLLAYEDDQVAGYVKLREGSKPKGLEGRKALEIARLYAMPDYIGKGIGKLLMEASIEIAREKGYNTVWLGVWEKNSRAISFYKSWGFEKFGETDFLLGNDHQLDWVMKKDLE